MTLDKAARKRILLIDDCAAARDLLTTILSVEGYVVETAPNGHTALLRLEAGSPPDLILMDLVMPVMSGWDFLRHRRGDPRLRAIPVVIFSGLGQGPAEVESLGADASVTKPIDEEELIDTL